MSKNGGIITTLSNANDALGSNISSSNIYAAKGRQAVFSTSSIANSSVSYVTSKTRNTNSIQGKIVGTGVLTDVSVQGPGAISVSDRITGIVSYTRKGDFRQDEKGYLVNSGGQRLTAWKLDEQEKLPQNFSLTSSLTDVNFASIKGAPVATTAISIAMNLNADQEALRGPGVDAILNRAGKNSSTGLDDIILPEQFSGGSLTIGDRFTFNSSTTNQLRTVEYGGIVAARRATTNDLVFGASSATRQFTFGVGANDLQVGQQLRIALTNGKDYTFTATQGTPSALRGEFNTISNLAAAINRIDALNARVDKDGRLYIAPAKADLGLTFTNIGGTRSIATELGLVNLAAVTPGPGLARFNSLSTLRDTVNNQQDLYSLKATVEGTGISRNLKITSLLSTADFTIEANSTGIVSINAATSNPTGNEIGRGTIFIQALNHNLIRGDFVKITGFGDPQVPDGLYAVTGTSVNGYNISRKATIAANVVAFPVIGPSTAPIAVAAGAAWQKTAGQQYQSFNNAVIQGIAANVITIDIAGAGAGVTDPFPGEAWAVDDIVYISGLGSVNRAGTIVSVPDGYYVISATSLQNGNADRRLAITQANTAGLVLGNLPVVPAGFSVQKIGSGGTNATNATAAMDTRAFVTVGGLASPASSMRLYMPNHRYAVNDTISFSGLAAPTLIDGITVQNDVLYTISAATQNYLEFKVLDANGVPLAATTGDGNTGAVDLIAGLGANFAVNNGSQMLKYFSINQETQTYEKTYDPTNVDKNLSAAVNGIANFDSDLTFSVPLTVYDSLGSSYVVQLLFAKLNSNEWAIELVAQKDENGVYDIINTLTDNGLIRQGIVKFDTDGNLLGIPEGFDQEIVINRNNGSEPSAIVIDWNNVMNEITGTVTQFKNDNNLELVQNNGKAASSLISYTFDKEGNIVGTFDTGVTQKLYRTPIAYFTNFDGLEAGANDTFQVTGASGDVVLKTAGQGGAGVFFAATLELSNIDTTSELLEVQELSNNIRAVARVLSVDNENFKNVLAELK